MKQCFQKQNTKWAHDFSLFLYEVNIYRLVIIFNIKLAFSLECVPNFFFFNFSTKIYVVGTQKNRLNEAALLSTQNVC